MCAASSSSASYSVSVSFSARTPVRGRSSGVDVWLFHCPCISGSPHAVRGAVYFSPVWLPPLGACPSTRTETTYARATTAPSPPSDASTLLRIDHLLRVRLLAEMPVHQLLGKLHALVFHQLRVLLGAPV